MILINKEQINEFHICIEIHKIFKIKALVAKPVTCTFLMSKFLFIISPVACNQSGDYEQLFIVVLSMLGNPSSIGLN